MLHNLFIELITQASALFLLTLPTFQTSSYHKHILTSLVLVHYCTKPRHINPVKVCYDNEQFCRRLRLQEYCSSKNHDNCSSTKNNKTTEWTPPDGRDQFIDSFAYRARTYSDNLVSSIFRDTRSNLPTNQQTALKDLSSNNDIVIEEADKGGTITIINKEDYITGCNTLLEDNRTYHKTTTNMMQTHPKVAENLLCSIIVPTSKLFVDNYQPNPNQHYSMPYQNYIDLNNSSPPNIVIII